MAAYGSRYRECAVFLTAKADDMDLDRAVALGELNGVNRLFDPAAAVLPSAAVFPLHHAARNGRVDAARLPPR